MYAKQTRYMCVFFVLNVEKHQKCFLQNARAASKTGSKRNIDVASVRCQQQMKRVRLVILVRKEISIIAIVRWQQQTRYMCIFFVLNVEKHQKCFL